MHKKYVEKYKPPMYEGNKTIEGLYDVQSEEVEKINKEIVKNINNTYIKTADIDGIRKWETQLEMYNNDDFTLEERRQNVLNKMLFTPPYTRQKLDQILFNIYGRGGYTFEIYPDDFKVIIDIDTSNPIIYLQFNRDVRYVIPANMDLFFAIQYTHLYLERNYTYGKMATMTYGELSKYATQTIKE